AGTSTPSSSAISRRAASATDSPARKVAGNGDIDQPGVFVELEAAPLQAQLDHAVVPHDDAVEAAMPRAVAVHALAQGRADQRSILVIDVDDLTLDLFGHVSCSQYSRMPSIRCSVISLMLHDPGVCCSYWPSANERRRHT